MTLNHFSMVNQRPTGEKRHIGLCDPIISRSKLNPRCSLATLAPTRAAHGQIPLCRVAGNHAHFASAVLKITHEGGKKTKDLYFV